MISFNFYLRMVAMSSGTELASHAYEDHGPTTPSVGFCRAGRLRINATVELKKSNGRLFTDKGFCCALF
jgi:hypothetical protein